MKATVNYNLEGDEEPGGFGRAQNLNLPPSGHGRLLLDSTRHAPKLQYLLGFSYIGTPGTRQEVTIDHLGPILSARLQFRGKNEWSTPRGQYCTPLAP